ncbi:MAG: inorganic diphosphatase [Flavobacteriales bacterium]|nr:inorganic diphosphatase [Flavobacteriales bacterium]
MARNLIMWIFALASCTSEPGSGTTMDDPELISASPRPGILHAVIEIPAGTSEKREYDPVTKTFPVNSRNGQPRTIRFLPYPANYGFIPGTLMDEAKGGDGDAVDVFVLCGALPCGTVLEVEPIGIIELLDAGERDDKVIAIPVDPALRTVDADDIEELPQAVQDILVTWLLNYDPEDVAQLVAVKGKADALATVQRWITP